MNIPYKLIQAFVFVVFLFATRPSHAQSLSCDSFQLQFIKSYGGSKSELAFGIVPTDDGGTISIGHSLSRNGDISDHFFSTDYWVVKTDGQGNIDWERSYGGNSSDAGKAIIKDSDGNFLLCGDSQSVNGDRSGLTNGALDFWIVKIDNTGNILWEKNYGGSDVENAFSIIEVRTGGYIVYGTTESSDFDVPYNNGMTDLWILKISDAGIIEWSKTYGGTGVEFATKILQTPDNGFIAIGNTDSPSGELQSLNGDRDIFILKLDSNGDLVWKKFMGGSDRDNANSIEMTKDGNFILSGMTMSNDGIFKDSHGDLDAWAGKMDGNGNFIWLNMYGGSQNDGAFGLVQSPFGGYYFSCYSNSKNGDFDSNQGIDDNWLLHLNELGKIDWKSHFGGSASEQIKFMTLQGNDLLLCGYTESSDDESGANKGGSDFYLMRFATADYPKSKLQPSEISCEGETVLFDATDQQCPTCQYQWDDGNTGASRSIVANLSKKYTVTITNSAGCSIESSIDILVSNLAVDQQIMQSNLCGRMGSVELVPTGQIGIPKFLWEDGNTSNHRENLPNGHYQVTITDDVCSIVSDFTIQTVGTIPLIDLGVAKEICGESTLELDASNSGATYLWSNGNTNPIITVDQSDTYTITVTSAEGCTVVDSIEVIIQQAPNLDLGEDFSTCAPFDLSTHLTDMTYNWSTGAKTPTIFIENTGDYSVTVTNVLGCSSSDTIHIEMSGDLNIDLGEDIISCDDILLNSGLSNATYHWSNNMVSQTISVFQSGTYSVTVTDDTGCSDIDSIDVTILPSVGEVRLGDDKAVCGPRIQKSNIAAASYLWSTGETTPDIYIENSGDYSLTVTNDAGCSSVGEITYVIKPLPFSTLKDSVYACTTTSLIAGENNFNYQWSNGENGPNISVSESGNYIVTISTTQGCRLIDTSYVSINEELEIAESVNHITCYNANDGIISVLALGGKKPITYNWGVYGNSGSIQNLREGIYTLNVTDSEGCSTVKSYTIHNPNPILIDFELNNFDCEGVEGTLIADIHGGTGEYSFEWDTEETTLSIPIDKSEWHFLSIIDEKGCEAKDSILVEPNNPIFVDTSFIVDNVCEGKSTGSIEVIINGGEAPYEYHWNIDGTNSNKLEHLSAGDYNLIVTDPNGCEGDFNFTVKSLPSLDANLKGISSCGEMTAWAFVQPNGGTPPYTYIWNTNDTTRQINQLEDGNYKVTVTDKNGCLSTEEIDVSNFPLLSIQTNVTPITCFDAKNGEIDLEITSGTAPFVFDWSNGVQAENTVTGLDTGIYTIYVKDKNECSIFETVTLRQPERLDVEIVKTSPNSTNNGKIEIKPKGGTPPYKVLWENGETTMIREHLNAGFYHYELTDTNGCTIDGQVELGTTATSFLKFNPKLDINPNPNAGEFFINLMSKSSFEGYISISNVLGEVVWKSKMLHKSNFHLPVNLQNFEQGIYFVTARNQKNQFKAIKMIIYAH